MKTRLQNVDLLKSIAIFCVVCCHLQTIDKNILIHNNFITWFNYIVFILPSIAVPVFLLVNGSLLMNKKLDMKKHVYKVLHLIGILLLWSGVLTVAIKYLNGEHLDILSIVQSMFQISVNSQYTCPLWFLQYLIMIYIFYPILKYIYDQYYKLYVYLLIIIGLFSIGLNTILILKFFLEIILHHQLSIIDSIVYFLNCFNPFSEMSICLLYFMIEGLLSSKHLQRKWVTVLSCISFGLFISEVILVEILQDRAISSIPFSTLNSTLNSLSLFLTVISIYFLTKDYHSRTNIMKRFIQAVGKNTMGIYLLHWPIIKLLNVYIISKHTLFFNNIFVNLFTNGFIVIICLLISILIGKIPLVCKSIKI